MTRSQQTLFAEDTHASRSTRPGSASAKKMTVISGRRCIESSEKFGPVGFLPRILCGTSLWDSTVCYLTWSLLGTPSGRLLYRLVPSAQFTEETESGFAPTPVSSADSKGSPADRYLGSETERGLLREWLRDGPDDPPYPNPVLVESMMGYPPLWTDLES